MEIDALEINQKGQRLEDRRQKESALLAAVAKQDRAAFCELYEAIERPALSLALQLTGNRGHAEEAVQEAMIRVWRFAGTFILTEQPRTWILKIVARESMRKYSRERKIEVDKIVHAKLNPALNNVSRDSKTKESEKKQVIDGLRACISQLPPQERQILALRFEAGYSQLEIGKALAIPQRTVSLRIKTVLNNLQSSLRTAGLASASVLESAEFTRNVVREALEVSFKPSVDLKQSILNNLPAKSEFLPQVSGASLFATTPMLIICASIALAVGGATLYVLGKEKPQGRLLQPALVSEAEVSGVPPPSKPLRSWTKKWSMDGKNQPFFHAAEPGRSESNFVYAKLPEGARLPLMIQVQLKTWKMHSVLMLSWTNINVVTCGPFKDVSNKNVRSRTYVAQFLISRECIIHSFKNEKSAHAFSGGMLFGSVSKNSRLMFSGEGDPFFESMTVTEIHPDAFPSVSNFGDLYAKHKNSLEATVPFQISDLVEKGNFPDLQFNLLPWMTTLSIEEFPNIEMTEAQASTSTRWEFPNIFR